MKLLKLSNGERKWRKKITTCTKRLDSIIALQIRVAWRLRKVLCSTQDLQAENEHAVRKGGFKRGLDRGGTL